MNATEDKQSDRQLRINNSKQSQNIIEIIKLWVERDNIGKDLVNILSFYGYSFMNYDKISNQFCQKLVPN